MSIRIEPVTSENVEAVIAMAITSDQQRFIHPPSVVGLLADVPSHPTFTAYSVYADETPVGFTIFGYNHSPETGWIAVLLIDHQHQGKGYGRAAMQVIIHQIQQDWPECREIGLSYKPDNLAAERLYLSLGFVKTDECRDDGDTVVRLRILS